VADPGRHVLEDFLGQQALHRDASSRVDGLVDEVELGFAVAWRSPPLRRTPRGPRLPRRQRRARGDDPRIRRDRRAPARACGLRFASELGGVGLPDPVLDERAARDGAGELQAEERIHRRGGDLDGLQLLDERPQRADVGLDRRPGTAPRGRRRSGCPGPGEARA
jgi:hypothetical protein